MSIETKSSTPAAAAIIGWATVFGITLALGILAMTVGLIRSETASDLGPGPGRRDPWCPGRLRRRHRVLLGQPAGRAVRAGQHPAGQPAGAGDRHAGGRGRDRLAAGRAGTRQPGPPAGLKPLG